MTAADHWISTIKAVERIRLRLNCSPGKAQKILSDAYASGEVRKSTAHIGPVESRPDGTLRPMMQEVSWTDLESWLADNPVAPKPQTITVTKSEKPTLSKTDTQKWFRRHVNRSKSQRHWFDEIRKVHPGHRISRTQLVQAWKTVPELQRLSPGQRPRENK